MAMCRTLLYAFMVGNGIQLLFHLRDVGAGPEWYVGSIIGFALLVGIVAWSEK